MPASMSVDERPLMTEGPVTEPVRDARRPVARGRRATPVLAMVGGLLTLALAAAILVRAGGGAHAGPVVATAPADPLAITLSARDVSVVTQVYQPGQDSGWHSHPGMHAVAVLSGTLTIYDSECRAQTVEPGRPYVGGQQSHLARNETSSPVEMVVTYLSPSTPASSTRRLAAPAGCAAAGPS